MLITIELASGLEPGDICGLMERQIRLALTRYVPELCGVELVCHYRVLSPQRCRFEVTITAYLQGASTIRVSDSHHSLDLATHAAIGKVERRLRYRRY